MWDAIAIHPTSDCKKQCPFCYTKGLGPDKPAIFFKNILGLCQKVPAWYFACNWVDANTWREIAGLLREALASGHPYALTTNYENLRLRDLRLFQGAEYVAVSLDEGKVRRHQFKNFILALERMRAQGVRVRVNVTLTVFMILQMVGNRLIERLAPHADMIYLLLPKSPERYWTPLPWLRAWLRFYHEKITQYEMFQKLELDHCLKSRLAPWRELVGPACAYRKVLTITPDGLIKICPYARAGFLLHVPEEITRVLEHPDEFQRKNMPGCFLPMPEMKREELVSRAG